MTAKAKGLRGCAARPRSPIYPFVKKRMAELGIKTEGQFAARFGFTQTHLSRLLYGDVSHSEEPRFNTPRLEMLPKLAEALDLTVYQVVDLYLETEVNND